MRGSALQIATHFVRGVGRPVDNRLPHARSPKVWLNYHSNRSTSFETKVPMIGT